MSIRIQILILMNLLVLSLSLFLAWLAGDVTRRSVERRLVQETAYNTSRFLQNRGLPLNDSIMEYLSDIFDAEFAMVDSVHHQLRAHSLDSAAAAEFQRLLKTRDGRVAQLAVGERRFRIASQPVNQADPAAQPELRLHALVPETQLLDASKAASRAILLWTVPVLLVTTCLALWLSLKISRPLHRLSREMDEIASAQQSPEERSLRMLAAKERRGPREIKQLADSFDELLERLQTLQTQLAHSQQLAALGKVAASVAHEIRNPLSGIKMNARVLRDQVEGREEAAESIAALCREAERMDLYLGELLELTAASRPKDSARDTYTMAPVSLPEIADSVLTLMSAKCRHAGIEVATEYDPDAPQVPGDRLRLRQVVLNFVINAIESMPAGGTLRVSCKTDAAGAVGLFVSDTGGGVEAAAGADVFEPFVSSKCNGAGLGLYISRRIIKTHGGRIGYDNTGEGACFWFWLNGSGEARQHVVTEKG